LLSDNDDDHIKGWLRTYSLHHRISFHRRRQRLRNKSSILRMWRNQHLKEKTLRAFGMFVCEYRSV
jgi:hypothetical protein